MDARTPPLKHESRSLKAGSISVPAWELIRTMDISAYTTKLYLFTSHKHVFDTKKPIKNMRESELLELAGGDEKALNEVFKRLDADLDGVLNKQELNAFMQMTEGCAMQDEVFDWIMQTFDR